MKTLYVAALLAGLALPTGLALAQEESDKVRKARGENELEKTAESTDQACGSKIAVVIDWASFDANAEWKTRSIASYCGEPLDQLRHLCEGAAVKAWVAKTVKRFECRAVRSLPEWSLTNQDGVLNWRVPPDAVNAGEFSKKQMLKNF